MDRKPIEAMAHINEQQTPKSNLQRARSTEYIGEYAINNTGSSEVVQWQKHWTVIIRILAQDQTTVGYRCEFELSY